MSFISEKTTIRGTQRRLERIARHIFQRAGPSATIKSVLIFGGDVTVSYRDVETVINQIYENRSTMNALTNRVTTDQLRNFLDAIVTVKIQLNPETVLVNGVEKIIYYLSILIIVDHPDDSGLVMISQIKEISGSSNIAILHGAILNATSGEILVAFEQSTSSDSFSFYYNPPSIEKQVIAMRMIHHMMIIEPIQPLSENELIDEVDKDDDISDDSDNDL